VSLTTGLLSASSTVLSFLKRAFGLFRLLQLVLTLTWAKSSAVAPYMSIRRLANRTKYTGLVAPSTLNRFQSGSFLRSPPPTGAKKPFGVVSAPMTRPMSQKPARIWARAESSA
jgi:hypothetical protein